jgi:hypothetical protein
MHGTFFASLDRVLHGLAAVPVEQPLATAYGTLAAVLHARAAEAHAQPQHLMDDILALCRTLSPLSPNINAESADQRPLTLSGIMIDIIGSHSLEPKGEESPLAHELMLQRCEAELRRSCRRLLASFDRLYNACRTIPAATEKLDQGIFLREMVTGAFHATLHWLDCPHQPLEAISAFSDEMGKGLAARCTCDGMFATILRTAGDTARNPGQRGSCLSAVQLWFCAVNRGQTPRRRSASVAVLLRETVEKQSPEGRLLRQYVLEPWLSRSLLTGESGDGDIDSAEKWGNCIAEGYHILIANLCESQLTFVEHSRAVIRFLTITAVSMVPIQTSYFPRLCTSVVDQWVDERTLAIGSISTSRNLANAIACILSHPEVAAQLHVKDGAAAAEGVPFYLPRDLRPKMVSNILSGVSKRIGAARGKSLMRDAALVAEMFAKAIPTSQGEAIEFSFPGYENVVEEWAREEMLPGINIDPPLNSAKEGVNYRSAPGRHTTSFQDPFDIPFPLDVDAPFFFIKENQQGPFPEIPQDRGRDMIQIVPSFGMTDETHLSAGKIPSHNTLRDAYFDLVGAAIGPETHRHGQWSDRDRLDRQEGALRSIPKILDGMVARQREEKQAEHNRGEIKCETSALTLFGVVEEVRLLRRVTQASAEESHAPKDAALQYVPLIMRALVAVPLQFPDNIVAELVSCRFAALVSCVELCPPIALAVVEVALYHANTSLPMRVELLKAVARAAQRMSCVAVRKGAIAQHRTDHRLIYPPIRAESSHLANVLSPDVARRRQKAEDRIKAKSRRWGLAATTRRERLLQSGKLEHNELSDYADVFIAALLRRYDDDHYQFLKDDMVYAPAQLLETLGVLLIALASARHVIPRAAKLVLPFALLAAAKHPLNLIRASGLKLLDTVLRSWGGEAVDMDIPADALGSDFAEALVIIEGTATRSMSFEEDEVIIASAVAVILTAQRCMQRRREEFYGEASKSEQMILEVDR